MYLGFFIKKLKSNVLSSIIVQVEFDNGSSGSCAQLMGSCGIEGHSCCTCSMYKKAVDSMWLVHRIELWRCRILFELTMVGSSFASDSHRYEVIGGLIGQFIALLPTRKVIMR